MTNVAQLSGELLSWTRWLAKLVRGGGGLLGLETG